jgi:transposase
LLPPASVIEAPKHYVNEIFLMKKLSKQEIINWLCRIEQSGLSTKAFFETYDGSEGERQYYRYKAKIHQDGLIDIDSNGNQGGNRKIEQREEDFIKGVIAGNPSVSLKKLQQLLKNQFDCQITRSGIKQALTRGANDYNPKRGRPKSIPIDPVVNSFGGFELIIAIAYYLKWPQRVEKVITEEIENLKNSELYQSNANNYDTEGRGEGGKFTESYNNRSDIRENRFASVTEKRLHKNFTTMSIIKVSFETILRKNLAMLALPVITLNGNVRTVDLALGQSLKHICGFDYKQKTIDKFLQELKYLSISTRLLRELTLFWKDTWSKDASMSMMGPLLCYYIDGNTKALWSSYRVKKNKVTMLGRVMGCFSLSFYS